MTIRILAAILLSISLSACWVSKEVLFTPDDYAKVDLKGAYKNTITREDSAPAENLVFEPQPDGSVKSTETYE